MSGSNNTACSSSNSNNTANGRFANAADLLLYRGHFSPEALSPSPRSPISSPLSSPLSSPRRYPSNPSHTHHTQQPASFDLLPPAMSAHGATPAPSQDHSDMVSHSADLVYHDDDEEALEDHRYNNSRRPSFQSHSRPSSPPLPPTTATILSHLHPNSLSVTPSSSLSSPSTSRPDGGPSSSATSPSQTIGNEHHTSHSHTLSPFSFFSHGSHSPNGEHHSTKTLKIELTHPEVVLMAGQTTLLEGVVYVNLHKTTKVKSLHLEFSGRSSVTWVDDNAYSPATRHQTSPHIEHSWALIPHQHKQPAILLSAGQYTYPFSMELTDVLPETLTTTHGKVAYRLTATLTKPGLTFNHSTVTLPVNVLRRHPIQPSRAYQRGGRAVSAAEDKIKYKITMPQTRVPHNTKVPLQVSITAPTPRTFVQVLQVGLWERVVYRADGRKRVDMRLVKIQKSEGWDRPPNHQSEAWNWNKVLLFDMPQMGPDQNNCNPSADNGLMKVTHILRFSILGTDGTKRFRVENEIDLKVLAFEDEFQIDPEETANGGAEGPDGELPSYLTSFSTPRVSFDSERDMDPGDDDLLRAMIQRIHLPSYAESEEDANSRNPSRDVSRSTSRTASRAPSRGTSPERSHSTGSHSPAPSIPVTASPLGLGPSASEEIGTGDIQDQGLLPPPAVLISPCPAPTRNSPSPDYDAPLEKAPR
ncbi:hypothetical protein BG015_007743 [Linnemannia schmuckeri]|uniref:Arrestin C-terminal-like domain-containing protein n=1 Tax=Linnemannia schmuckeri TaxID=64567 RepID=A0A9P5RY21_9FUNG|nr:hypothetical protein BG015_007743 [Linnemannia schmuckeri]